MTGKKPVTIAILKVQGRELPKPWAERVGASYDTEVDVTLTTQGQQIENLKAKLERSQAKAGRRKIADTFKIEDDPIFSLGETPIESKITDASTNHDKYLYQGR